MNEPRPGNTRCSQGVAKTSSPMRCGGAGCDLALAVLRRLAGLLETGLLALDGTRVTRQEAGLLQRRAVRVDVGLVQGAGDTETQGVGLAGDAATVDTGDDVVTTVQLQ